jgi:hypothetical protein
MHPNLIRSKVAAWDVPLREVFPEEAGRRMRATRRNGKYE